MYLIFNELFLQRKESPKIMKASWKCVNKICELDEEIIPTKEGERCHVKYDDIIVAEKNAQDRKKAFKAINSHPVLQETLDP